MNKIHTSILTVFVIGLLQCNSKKNEEANIEKTTNKPNAPIVSPRTMSVSGHVSDDWIGEISDAYSVLDYVKKAGGPKYTDANGNVVTDIHDFIYTVTSIDKTNERTKSKSRMGDLSTASTDKDLIDAVGIYVEVKGEIRGILDPR